MARILILIVVVAALLLLLKRLFGASPEPEQLEGKTENMQQCKYCGIHVPESAVVWVNNTPYCSQQHADLDQ